MNHYRPHQFAKIIGVSVSTLRRWDNEGVLPAKRTGFNQRYYTDDDIALVRQRNGVVPEDKKIVVYCRVSSKAQKDDLASQLSAMQQFCLARGIAVDEWHEEIGGGLNFKRKVFLSLMYRIIDGEIKQLYVAHKDRLARFGFDFFEEMAQRQGCQIIVANQEQLSPQQEMVEDMLAIVHSFSSRLYGLRKYKSKIKNLIEDKP
ncbi:IS607 family transposase [Moraxella sp. ZJ142]|uniref:IS607 family transposase n=1 Tax=Moraxella marmotae TaxID=3344520 RepID=UPI0035D414FA